MQIVLEEKKHKQKVKNKKYNSDRYIRDKENNSYRLFYSSNAWRNKRLEILKKYDFKCAICDELYKLTTATDVHHILNLKDNYKLRLDNDNLIPLCSKHHKLVHNLELNNIDKIKTFIEREKKKDKHIKNLEQYIKNDY